MLLSHSNYCLIRFNLCIEIHRIGLPPTMRWMESDRSFFRMSLYRSEGGWRMRSNGAKLTSLKRVSHHPHLHVAHGGLQQPRPAAHVVMECLDDGKAWQADLDGRKGCTRNS